MAAWLPHIMAVAVVAAFVAGAAGAADKAFYVLFSSMLEDPSWPHAYAPYAGGVVIMRHENATRDNVQRVKDTLNATVLLYFDSIDLQIPAKGKCAVEGRSCSDDPQSRWHCATGRVPCCKSIDCDAYNASSSPLCSAEDPFVERLRQAVPTSWTVNQLPDAGSPGAAVPVCTYGFGPLTLPFENLIEKTVPLVAGLVNASGFDGVYLDMFLSTSLMAEELQRWLGTKHKYDANGDGKPDSLPDMVAQYAKYQPEFSARLRTALGSRAVMIANTASNVKDPALNGITLEMEACGSDPTHCEAWLHDQATVAHSPQVSVVWLTHSESVPAKLQCTLATRMHQNVPWLRIGTDFYDGSHVVCP